MRHIKTNIVFGLKKVLRRKLSEVILHIFVGQDDHLDLTNLQIDDANITGIGKW